MSALFFSDLGLPEPDAFLGVNSGSHAQQTARVVAAFDQFLDASPSDLVIVVGDVNSTLACALVAAKRGIPVAHVEAGLRSRDRAMPEEVNRILTDHIADILLTTERSADQNLLREGIAEDRIHFVGNVMIDALFAHRHLARRSAVLSELGLAAGAYALCTLHRPSNVDGAGALAGSVRAVELLAERMPVVFPVHPRTRSRLADFHLLDRLTSNRNIRVTEPQGYVDFLALMDGARLVLTDSGGVQEETTVLSVPCFTFRETTERPVTVTQGTNTVVGADHERLEQALNEFMAGQTKVGRVPELWDGHAAERIVQVICDHCGVSAACPDISEPGRWPIAGSTA